MWWIIGNHYCIVRWDIVWNIFEQSWTAVIKKDKYRKLQHFLCFLRHQITNCQGLHFLYLSVSRTDSSGEFWEPVIIFICIKCCIYEEIKSILHLGNCCNHWTQKFLSYLLLGRTVNIAREAEIRTMTSLVLFHFCETDAARLCAVFWYSLLQVSTKAERSSCSPSNMIWYDIILYIC
jgi:hypothetical protein